MFVRFHASRNSNDNDAHKRFKSLIDSFEMKPPVCSKECLIEEILLCVYLTIIDALRKQSDMKEAIDQLPKDHQLDAIRFLEFVESD